MITSVRQHEGWREYARRFKIGRRKCQWCTKKTNHVFLHHIGCVRFNPLHLFDPRILLICCWDCHQLLEPWAKIKLEQYFPQLFDGTYGN